jgi:ABC-type polar amino acid transport system ATPase subunit
MAPYDLHGSRAHVRELHRAGLLDDAELAEFLRTLDVLAAEVAAGSTLLRCINHLEAVSNGRIWVGGEVIGYRQDGNRLTELSDTQVARQRRSIGMVFQRFNLFPHMTALENVIEATRVQRLDAGQARQEDRPTHPTTR